MALYDLTLGSEAIFYNATLSALNTGCCYIDTNKVAVIFKVSGDIYAIVGTLSSGTWTWGSAAAIQTSDTEDLSNNNICKVATDKFAVTYSTGSSSGSGKVKICSVSTRTITVGTETDMGGPDAYIGITACCYVSDDKIAMACSQPGAAGKNSIMAATISGTTPTIGTKYDIAGVKLDKPSLVCIATDKVVCSYEDYTNSDIRAACAEISGTNMTITTDQVILSAIGYRIVSVKLDTDKFLLVYNYSSSLYAQACSVSTRTISLGGIHVINDGGSEDYPAVASAQTNTFVVSYFDGTNGRIVAGNVTADAATVEIGTSITTSAGDKPSITTVPGSANTFCIFYPDSGNSSKGTDALVTADFTISSIKTINGLAKASVKTVNGLAIASVKSVNDLT